MSERKFLYVSHGWDDDRAASLSPVEKLVYRSNLLGSDQRITNTGGGNTSSKISERDPLTGADTEVLWVKGSGGDLRTSGQENFSSLYQEKLIGLQAVYAVDSGRGLKTEAEDRMVGMYSHTTFNLNPRPSSIDTPLHAFIPFNHVDHMHPNAVIAVAASRRSAELTREIFGEDLVYTPWMRPGFELGLEMKKICREHPQAKGILMGQHGVINWHDDAKECYLLTLELIEKAASFIEQKYQASGGHASAFGGEKYSSMSDADRLTTLVRILPWMRGQVSQERLQVATYQDDPAIRRFVNSHDAARLAELGTSCPDHFLRTKIKPLYIDWDPASGDVEALRNALADGLETYRDDYAAYYKACCRPGSPAMRNPNPTVVLIPGIGMIAWGKNKSESRVTAEFYNCAVEVMRGAEAIDAYIALPQQEAFDIEYWALEEAKLQRMPPERELDRQVHVVIGAGWGIGRATAHRLGSEGAHVVAVDRDGEAAEATCKGMIEKVGAGIGVAGSGISGCGQAIALTADITDRASIRGMLDDVVLAYGGFDAVVVTAGIFVPSDVSGRIPDDRWAVTFSINVTGSYLVADEAHRIWQDQGLSGCLVLTTSANAVVPKKGSIAYDTSKAAANHLVRELAIELAPLVRVNGVAPATVVQGSAMFPRDRVIGSLAKYGIDFTDTEPTASLVKKLAQFYADRTLTGSPITPEDQAEAYFLLVSKRLSKTTGQIITVDGGLHEAFLR